jgi:hypothetical protein
MHGGDASIEPLAHLVSIRPMSRLQVGLVRYATVAKAIGQALGVDPVPVCQIGQGRITLIFRRIGASRWPEDQQIEYAFRAAATARAVLADDARRIVRDRADRAIVVVYEDVTLVRGCAVVARWECVLPREAHDR